ncbi:MAG: hypothetical protein WD939_10215 [Dehalococcoidia bacterium]
MIPPQERLIQLARLIGLAEFVERFGSPRTAEPSADDLRALIDERLGHVAEALVAEAAASDDVTGGASAQAYLADRLATLGDLFSDQQSAGIRASFREATSGW